MATCGYICPQCEGSGFLENGDVCDWCTEKPKTVVSGQLPSSISTESPSSITDEEWMREVHEGKCCGD